MMASHVVDARECGLTKGRQSARLWSFSRSLLMRLELCCSRVSSKAEPLFDILDDDDGEFDGLSRVGTHPRFFGVTICSH